MPCRSLCLLALPLLAGVALCAAPHDPVASPPGPTEEDALLRSLFRHSVEIDLGGRNVIEGWMKDSAGLVRENERTEAKGIVPALAGPVRSLTAAHRAWLLRNPELAGLPFVAEGKEHLGEANFDVLADVSNSSLSPSGNNNNYRSGDLERISRAFTRVAILEVAVSAHPWDRGKDSPIRVKDMWSKRAVAGLMPAAVEQVGLSWPAEVRVGMVSGVSQIDSAEAVEVVARRAVLDPSPTVRKAALAALWGKPRVARPVLLAGLRHPWPPAAAHAARALVVLDDKAAVPDLKRLLALPSPTEPFRDDDGRWRKTELVRINHLRNCLMCHPPLVRYEQGTLPGNLFLPNKPPPTEKASHGSIDAAVVFLRQEFSTLHHCVAGPVDWPESQRFDYVTRTRPLTDTERRAHLVARAEKGTYPQREAIRWALARLEGKR